MLALGGKRILPSLLFVLLSRLLAGIIQEKSLAKRRNIVGNVQEKMKKNREKLRGLVTPEETPAQAALREACDEFVEQACDAIRRDMEREKAEGNVRYDLREPLNSSNEQKGPPHYLVRWNVECDINFKKKESFFELDTEKSIVRFGFAIPVFYILEEMEKKLAEDHIYPVQIREKRVGLLRKKAGMETVKVHMRRPDVCNGLDAASRDYSAGFTAPHIDFETGSDFAYFLTDENQEGK